MSLNHYVTICRCHDRRTVIPRRKARKLGMTKVKLGDAPKEHVQRYPMCVDGFSAFLSKAMDAAWEGEGVRLFTFSGIRGHF